MGRFGYCRACAGWDAFGHGDIFARAYDKHRKRRFAHDALGDATEEEPLESVPPEYLSPASLETTLRPAARAADSTCTANTSLRISHTLLAHRIPTARQPLLSY